MIGNVNCTNISNNLLHFGVILGENTYLDQEIFLKEKISLLPIIKW